MKLKYIHVLHIVLVLLITTIIVMCTNYYNKPDTIVIPEKKGILIDSIPREVLRDSIFVYQLRDTIIKYNRPLDTVYIEKFIKAPADKKTEIYIEAIAERTYKNVVEDSLLRIDYTANTQGKLLDIKFDYTIKPVTISVPKTKESVFSAYAGVGLKTTTSLESLTPTLQLGIQGKNGNMFVGSVSSDKTIQAGYMFRIINIKK